MATATFSKLLLCACLFSTIFSLNRAQASTVLSTFDKTVNCKVDSISGVMGSFLPPAVGDTVTIEAGEVSLIKLQFSGGKMIPVNKPLQKHSMPNSSDYMVYFQSVQDESNIGSSTLTVMVGKFGNGGGVDSYSATIQYIYQSKDSGLITTLDEAKLSCVAKPL